VLQAPQCGAGTFTTPPMGAGVQPQPSSSSKRNLVLFKVKVIFEFSVGVWDLLVVLL